MCILKFNKYHQITSPTVSSIYTLYNYLLLRRIHYQRPLCMYLDSCYQGWYLKWLRGEAGTWRMERWMIAVMSKFAA